MTRLLQSFWSSITRKKTLGTDGDASHLRRCLSTLDLTVVGVGSISGVGIYILTGTVIHDKTGPAGFVSYALAGLVALLNAVCYAELGCRIPKAGSAYTFTYIAAGELPAFVIGWSLVLEYVIGSASVARGWSSTLDALTGGAIRNGTMSVFGSLEDSSGFVSEYPDVLAGGLIVLLGLVLMSGAKLSSRFNLATTAMNFVVLGFMIIVLFANTSPETFAPEDHGGFLPYSLTGVVGGAATLFYSYIGFDAIVVSVEEATDPVRSIPRALVITILLATSVKIICAVGLVLYVPWWTVDVNSGFVVAFRSRGLDWAAWITGAGSLLGISAVLLITLFSAPRIIFAMARDGLLFRCLGYVWPRTQVPLSAICLVTPIAAVAATFFDIATLADFISIGTLIAFIMVACSVLRTRYKLPEYLASPDDHQTAHVEEDAESDYSYIPLRSPSQTRIEGRLKPRFSAFPIISNWEPGTACMIAVAGYVLFICCFSLTLFIGLPLVIKSTWWTIVLLCLFGSLSLLCVFVMAIHQPDFRFKSFQTPLMPFLPCLCIFMNLCLILSLPAITWTRFGIWLATGLLIYFCYGIRASSERSTIEKVAIADTKTTTYM